MIVFMRFITQELYICIYTYTYIYIYVYICIYTSGGTTFMLVGSLTQNIHLGQPRITFPSPFRVAGVGRSIITLF